MDLAGDALGAEGAGGRFFEGGGRGAYRMLGLAGWGNKGGDRGGYHCDGFGGLEE